MMNSLEIERELVRLGFVLNTESQKNTQSDKGRHR